MSAEKFPAGRCCIRPGRRRGGRPSTLEGHAVELEEIEQTDRESDEHVDTTASVTVEEATLLLITAESDDADDE